MLIYSSYGLKESPFKQFQLPALLSLRVYVYAPYMAIGVIWALNSVIFNSWDRSPLLHTDSLSRPKSEEARAILHVASSEEPDATLPIITNFFHHFHLGVVNKQPPVLLRLNLTLCYIDLHTPPPTGSLQLL